MAAKEAGVEDVLTSKDIEAKMYGLVGIWMETFLYGLYLYLFVSAMTILARKNALQTFSSKVFFAGIVTMFILISFHNSLNIYRIVAAFGYNTDARGPALYLIDFLRWENYSLSVLLALIFWTGDILVIYRCFLIWQRNYWIIAVPLLLFLASVASHIMNLWAGRIFTLSNLSAVPSSLPPALNMLFPLYATQNVVTTLLIILRIFLACHETKRTGTVALHTPSLVLLMRIVMESAAIYTTEIVIAFV
ncbi:hypothetical protein BKA70DRAFT_1578376 [Coprinopsis sp. MPI-PUGE-AT-0042]|nr:hypothetical protein BKA70DRAFT_1578376 [Coprinopsis sp. MPI-PUGE-AT-0042]